MLAEVKDTLRVVFVVVVSLFLAVCASVVGGSVTNDKRILKFEINRFMIDFYNPSEIQKKPPSFSCVKRVLCGVLTQEPTTTTAVPAHPKSRARDRVGYVAREREMREERREEREEREGWEREEHCSREEGREEKRHQGLLSRVFQE